MSAWHPLQFLGNATYPSAVTPASAAVAILANLDRLSYGFGPCAGANVATSLHIPLAVEATLPTLDCARGLLEMLSARPMLSGQRSTPSLGHEVSGKGGRAARHSETAPQKCSTICKVCCRRLFSLRSTMTTPGFLIQSPGCSAPALENAVLARARKLEGGATGSAN